MKTPPAKTDAGFALRYAKEQAKMDGIKVKRHNISPKLVTYVEKEIGVKFDRKPKLYTYKPVRGRRFSKRKKIGDWMGQVFMPIKQIDKTRSRVENAYIILPQSHMCDDKVKNTILIHELSEALQVQENLKHKINTHEQAMDIESTFAKKVGGLQRPQLYNRAKQLYNNPENWKHE
jgi:hypothetical protein